MSFRAQNADAIDRGRLLALRSAISKTIFAVAILTLLVSSGCARWAPLRPRSIPAHPVYQSQRLLDNQPQIQRGQRRPIIDGIGWVIGIPSKLLLWNRRVENHNISQDTEQSIARYLEHNGLSTVRVRLNQYHPLDDWRRLVRNDSVGAGWRYTFGAISVLGETIFPGRLIGGDHFNPYTNTVHIYSDVPAIAVHEAGHSKDFARRYWKGTYAAVYLLPIVPLYHESIASGDALAYIDEHESIEQQASARKILYPAYATYVGGAAGTVFPSVSTPLYYGSVIAGHAAGRYQARQVMNQPGTGPVPTPPSAENQAIIGSQVYDANRLVSGQSQPILR